MRNGTKMLILLLAVSSVFLSGCGQLNEAKESTRAMNETIVSLPGPRFTGDISLEETLQERRSIREYSGESLTLDELSQVLWAAQGITNEYGNRTAPSAGGLYPLEMYVVAGDVKELEPGIYRYLPSGHELVLVVAGDRRTELCKAALDQSWVRDGAVTLVMSAIYERTTERYGERGIRYVHMEAGHAGQNICLQATALGLGTVTIGAFHDEEIASLLAIAENETPLYVLPIGRKITG